MRFVIALTLILPVVGPAAAFAQKSVDVPELDLSSEPAAPKKPARKPKAAPPRKARRAPAPKAPAARAPEPAAPAVPAPAPAPAPPPAAAPGQAADEQAERARTLEDRVNDLKEKIFRTKTRLMNLQEMVIGGDVSAGARAVLRHRNEMGSAFVLESAAYALDGSPVYTKVDQQGDLGRRDEFEVYSGRVTPGSHDLSVNFVYRGHGYGIFSYLDEYRFKVQSHYSFDAEAGKITSVRVVGFEKGNFTDELKDRPAVRYDVDVQLDQAGKKASPQ